MRELHCFGTWPVTNSNMHPNIRIIPIPGVSSITSSISVSGFKDQFFMVFFPKQKKSEKILSSLSQLSFSQVFFIPIKINFYLKSLNNFFR